MSNIIGRKEELFELNRALESKEAELIAIYGRRRVGKTFLIREAYKKHLVFQFTGTQNGTTEEHLIKFSQELSRSVNSTFPIKTPESWSEAFYLLRDYLTEKLKNNTKQVVFLDEIPWLNTPRSKFLQEFDYFWNSWASAQPSLIIVICGSAASWMITQILNNRGGLHNRVTKRIRLLPFTLKETSAFLENRDVHLEYYQTIQLYMALGGIPFYLKEVRPGESSDQAIDRLLFSENGSLHGEFQNLYPSLFENVEQHIKIIRALGDHPNGLQRNEITQSAITSGGTLTKILEELTESGFIRADIQFNRSAKYTIYRLVDEYSRFYLKFIDKKRSIKAGKWLKQINSPSWRSWSGIAFEGICLKHIEEIKKALNIGAVYTEESPWRLIPKEKNEKGIQIDLLIDRQDHCINICEMKFYSDKFTIDKQYAEQLRHKSSLFKQYSGTQKSIFITAVTTYGVADGIYKRGLIQNEVTMDAFFA